MEKFPGKNSKQNKDALGQKFLESYKNGYALAFNQLYNLYEKDVINSLKRNNIPDNVIEDLKSEIFAKVAKAIEKNQYEKMENTTLGSWINTIAINAAMDYHRALKKERRNYPLNEAFNHIPDDDNPLDSLETKEQLEILMQKIDRLLTVKQKEIIMMRADGMSYEEIAQAKNLPLGTVKSHIKRTREILKEYLDKK